MITDPSTKLSSNKVLSDSMVKVLNDNWQDIFRALKKDMEKVYGAQIEKVINSVFMKTPYKDLFKN